MMTMVAVVFVLAYSMIALEHPIKINKSATALLAAAGVAAMGLEKIEFFWYARRKGF